MALMKAAMAAVLVMEKEGVTTAFGVPGAAINPLYAQLRERQSITHILARHVEGASHMAEGYTRAKAGNIGVCIGTSGPAGTDMITASFLVKHLLIDWRWGEAYFAQKLLDFDLAANNGGWQWAAGSGCDAAPYFRIFNPYEQTRKFDPELKYIRKWVPEFEDFSKYPAPIVDHKFARERCLQVFKAGLGKLE